MNVDRSGLTAAPEIRELREADVPPATQMIFAEIRDVLRVPFVDQLWRVLAAYPTFLIPAWRWLAPILGSVEAEGASDVLRLEAAIPLAYEMPAHKAFRGDLSRAEIGADDRARISNYTAAAHYVLPKLLLATTLLADGLANGIDPRPVSWTLTPLARGVPAGVPRVEPPPPDRVIEESAAVLSEIGERHGYTPLPDYYRAIALAGDFLRLAWNALRPIVGDPICVDRGRALAREAAQQSKRLSAAAPARLSVDRDRLEITQLLAILRFYANHLLPDALIDVTIIKGLTDGPDTATYNRFSLTGAEPAVETAGDQ